MSTVSGPQELIPSSSETRSQIWHSHTSLFCPERTYQVTTQSLQDLKAIFGGGGCLHTESNGMDLPKHRNPSGRKPGCSATTCQVRKVEDLEPDLFSCLDEPGPS